MSKAWLKVELLSFSDLESSLYESIFVVNSVTACCKFILRISSIPLHMPHTLEEEEGVLGLVERTTDLSSFVGVICLFLPAASATADSD